MTKRNTSKRRLKSNRFLPEFVTSFKDRHGKVRLRFRRKGYPGGYFEAPLGTEDFRREYTAFNNPDAPKVAAAEAAAKRIVPGTIADLRRQYYAVPTRLGPTEITQGKVMSVLDRGFFEGREDRPIALVAFDHIDAIIEKRKVRFQNPETKRWEGGIEAARKLRKELVRAFDFAEMKGMIAKSPMKHAQRVKVAPGQRSKGFRTWTEADIAQYRLRHPLGSKARLAMELMLWTDQRSVDSIHLGRQHIKAGRFVLTQSKGGKALILAIAPQLLEAIVAMPANPDAMCFLLNDYGVSYSRKGFGNKFRQWCDQAGLQLCSAHGLRKATMRRMAELEMPNKTMKSVSGHSRDDEVTLYTEAANQERLARDAIGRLAEWEAAPPEEREDAMAKAATAAIDAWSMSNLPAGLDTDPEQRIANAR